MAYYIHSIEMEKRRSKEKASLVEKHKELYEGRWMDTYVHMIEIAYMCTYVLQP